MLTKGLGAALKCQDIQKAWRVEEVVCIVMVDHWYFVYFFFTDPVLTFDEKLPIPVSSRSCEVSYTKEIDCDLVAALALLCLFI